MTQDRVRSDQFDLSHEFMAILLGSTRPTVSVVAGSLQKAGVIRYKYSRITIVDRKKLEASSCECYRTITAEFDRLKLYFRTPASAARLTRSRSGSRAAGR